MLLTNKNNFIPKELSFCNSTNISFTKDNWNNNKIQILKIFSDDYIKCIIKTINISTIFCNNTINKNNNKPNKEPGTFPCSFSMQKIQYRRHNDKKQEN